MLTSWTRAGGRGGGHSFRLRRHHGLHFIEFPYTCAAHPHRVRSGALLTASHALLWCKKSFLSTKMDYGGTKIDTKIDSGRTPSPTFFSSQNGSAQAHTGVFCTSGKRWSARSWQNERIRCKNAAKHGAAAKRRPPCGRRRWPLQPTSGAVGSACSRLARAWPRARSAHRQRLARRPRIGSSGSFVRRRSPPDFKEEPQHQSKSVCHGLA